MHWRLQSHQRQAGAGLAASVTVPSHWHGCQGPPASCRSRSRRLAPGSGWRTRWTRAGSSQRAGQAKPWEAPWPARPVTATCRTQRNRRCTTTAAPARTPPPRPRKCPAWALRIPVTPHQQGTASLLDCLGAQQGRSGAFSRCLHVPIGQQHIKDLRQLLHAGKRGQVNGSRRNNQWCCSRTTAHRRTHHQVP